MQFSVGSQNVKISSCLSDSFRNSVILSDLHCVLLRSGGGSSKQSLSMQAEYRAGKSGGSAAAQRVDVLCKHRLASSLSPWAEPSMMISLGRGGEGAKSP